MSAERERARELALKIFPSEPIGFHGLRGDAQDSIIDALLAYAADARRTALEEAITVIQYERLHTPNHVYKDERDESYDMALSHAEHGLRALLDADAGKGAK